MSELLVCGHLGAAFVATTWLGCAQRFWWVREPLTPFHRAPGTSSSPLPQLPLTCPASPPSPQVPVVVATCWLVPSQGGEAAVPKVHRAGAELTAPCNPSAPCPVRAGHKDPHHFLRCISAAQCHISPLEKHISLSCFLSQAPVICFCVSYLAFMWPKICLEGLSH